MHDVRMGAMGGAGIAALEMGSADEAERLYREVTALLGRTGAAWFQGRERAEAFVIRFLVARGDLVSAVARFNRALRAAGDERYGALWLTAEVVPALAHAECSLPYDLVAEARRDAELAGFRPLVRRLSAFAGPPRHADATRPTPLLTS